MKLKTKYYFKKIFGVQVKSLLPTNFTLLFASAVKQRTDKLPEGIQFHINEADRFKNNILSDIMMQNEGDFVRVYVMRDNPLLDLIINKVEPHLFYKIKELQLKKDSACKPLVHLHFNSDKYQTSYMIYSRLFPHGFIDEIVDQMHALNESLNNSIIYKLERDPEAWYESLGINLDIEQKVEANSKSMIIQATKPGEFTRINKNRIIKNINRNSYAKAM